MKDRTLLVVGLAASVVACGGQATHGGAPGDDVGASDGASGVTPAPARSDTYLLEIPWLSWVEPEGVGDDIAGFVGPLLLNVEREVSGETAVTVGFAFRGGEQDTCSPTERMTATASPPEVRVGPGDVEVYMRGVETASEQVAVLANVTEFTLVNVLPDGDTVTETGELHATVDAREVYPLFYQIADASPDTVCGTFETVGGDSCEPCADGERYCVTLVARGIGAVPFDGEFEEVDAACPPVLPE